MGTEIFHQIAELRRDIERLGPSRQISLSLTGLDTARLWLGEHIRENVKPIADAH